MSTVKFYNTTYGDFASQVRAQIRKETYGKDIGQNSWLTADELDRFARLAGYSQQTALLEVACGSGGPAIYLAETLGLRVTGADINEAAIDVATATAADRNVADRARFCRVDASAKLPFEDQSFNAVQCIDSINHLPDRLAVLKEWHRVLKLGGMLLYTDPIIVTGALTHEEIATRSSIGFFLFVPPGENERVLREAGFTLVQQTDVTENEALTSARWIAAREARRAELTEIEGRETFEGTQRFLETVHALSATRRLSRHVFLARRI
jgi:ubiquinone/menaquinone biosynthesis C-methylase UbiE